MSLWYSRRKKEEKSLRLAAAGIAVEQAFRLYRKIDRKK